MGRVFRARADVRAAPPVERSADKVIRSAQPAGLKAACKNSTPVAEAPVGRKPELSVNYCKYSGCGNLRMASDLQSEVLLNQRAKLRRGRRP